MVRSKPVVLALTAIGLVGGVGCQDAAPHVASPASPPPASTSTPAASTPATPAEASSRPTGDNPLPAPPPDPAEGDPLSLGIPARAELEPPPGGLPRGAVSTSDCRPWPCARRTSVQDETARVDRRYVYDGRRSCQLPVELVLEGTVGCVSRVLLPAHDRWYDQAHLEYDDEGRLTSLRSNLGTTRYEWSAEGPHSDDAFPREREPGRLRWNALGTSVFSVVDVDADGRPVRAWSRWALAGQSVEMDYVHLDWRGPRLDHVQHYHDGRRTTRHELIYDCAALGPIPATPNREGPLGVPLRLER